jgi:hypothetical protein
MCNFITKQGKSKLTVHAMQSLMYAVVMCRVKDFSTHGVGIYDLTRAQNIGNKFDFIMSIDVNMIEQFEAISGVNLRDPLKVELT